MSDVFQQAIPEIIKALNNAGVSFESGLTASEVAQIEERHRFYFPPDLRSFLQSAVPIRWKHRSGFRMQEITDFPNWRASLVEGQTEYREWMSWITDGICFDVEHSQFWMSEWGQKPADLASAFKIIQQAVLNAPTLIPIYGHRFIPTEPSETGNPVFSIWQTDIIEYGSDLAAYFHNEFGIPLPEWAAKSAREIQFWSRLVERNNIEE
jgi:hypothetical protein